MTKKRAQIALRLPRAIMIGLWVLALSTMVCTIARFALGWSVLAGRGERLFLAASPWLEGVGRGSSALFLILLVYSIVRYSRVERG